MQNVKNTIADKLLAMVAPHPCFNCGKLGRSLCDDCKYDIVKTGFTDCIVCGRACRRGVCTEHLLPFERAWVGGLRKGALKETVNAFKFHYQRAALQDLTWLLDKRVPPLPSDTIVIPVPTRPAHVRQRGYDHAALLANAFAYRRGLAVQPVLRKEGQVVQHQLDRKDRLDAARTAFHAVSILSPAPLYVIVDDVITTGATVTAAADALRLRGARHIAIAALAYQPLD